MGSCAETASILPITKHYRTHSLVEDEDEVASKYVSDAERLSASYPQAKYDFYGTPSGALCVYKTGDAWPVRTGPESQRIIREARPVYDHPIASTWCEVGERIYTLLDEKKVRWTSIDPLGFAEAGKERFSSLLLWIGVEPGSLPYEDANTAAEAVTFFLAEAGFEDIEIGFRESIVTCSVSGPQMLDFKPFRDSIAKLRKPFTPTLGLSIAPLNNPDFEGTGALYFRESKESDDIFLLTCAHVARPPPFHSNTSMVRNTESHPREQIIALGNQGYTNAVESMMMTIGDQVRLINDGKDILHMLGEPEQGEDEDITEERKENLALVEKAQKTIAKADEFHSEVTKRWTTPRQRIIGEVIHVEPIDVGVKPFQYARDWALIKLYKDKFNLETFRGNKVYIGTQLLADIISQFQLTCYTPAGGNISSLDYGKMMFPNPEDMEGYKYPQDGLLQVSGVVQAQEIQSPTHLDANGEKCFFAVKNGLATGTTIGRVLGMESFTRVYNENSIEKTSREIAVLPFGSMSGPFSAPGDSGSIVLARDGRILGMMTGGAGATYRTDVTYLTPYWYIEEEIKRVFPDCHLY